MKNKMYPADQSHVLFTGKDGISRQGRYVSNMNAFVEYPGDEGLEDCSNIYPEDDIAAWDYIEGASSDDSVITKL